MPLKKSDSKSAFYENFKKERESGKSIAQSYAIAASVQKEAKKKKTK